MSPSVVINENGKPIVIDIERDGGLGWVWIARPEKRNALDEAVLDGLARAMQELAEDDAVRVIILAGRGRAFSAGADLEWMHRAAGYAREENIADAERLVTALTAIDTVGKPTIARLHGSCYAGAIGLASVCDLALASEDCRFCFSEARLGLVPATISPYVMRAIGYRSSLRWILTAEPFTAATALQIGLINEIVSEASLDARINELAAHFMAGGARALAATKQLLRQISARPIDASVHGQTIQCIADARASAEGAEGIRALLSGERPDWGRS
jgi:methylglutaconyl-CoA hydratase